MIEEIKDRIAKLRGAIVLAAADLYIAKAWSDAAREAAAAARQSHKTGSKVKIKHPKGDWSGHEGYQHASAYNGQTGTVSSSRVTGKAEYNNLSRTYQVKMGDGKEISLSHRFVKPVGNSNE